MATTRQLAVSCAKGCDEKKATAIVVLDVRKLTSIADYFIVCSVTSDRQGRAIVEDLRGRMKEQGIRELGVEGLNDSHWVLQDFGDVVIHVLLADRRDYYDIEGLWSDAPRVRWAAAAKE